MNRSITEDNSMLPLHVGMIGGSGSGKTNALLQLLHEMKQSKKISHIDIFSGQYDQADCLAKKPAPPSLLKTYGIINPNYINPLETHRFSNVLAIAKSRKSTIESSGYSGTAAVIEEPHFAWTDDSFKKFDAGVHDKDVRNMIMTLSSAARHQWCTLFVLSQSVDFIFNNAIFANLQTVWISGKITDDDLETVRKRLILKTSMKKGTFVRLLPQQLSGCAASHVCGLGARARGLCVCLRPQPC